MMIVSDVLCMGGGDWLRASLWIQDISSPCSAGLSGIVHCGLWWKLPHGVHDTHTL